MDNLNIFENIPKIEQPEEMKVSLFQHQLASVYSMEKRENEKKIIINDNTIDLNISIHANPTGYGKTLSMITLVYRNKMDWKMNEKYSQSNIISMFDGRLKKTENKYYDKIDTTLVLTGQSVINQWYEECLISPLCVAKIISNKDINNTCVFDYDIILVTPSMYNNLILKYHNMAWKRFIYDDPCNIKLSNMRNIISGFIWLVTATPYELLNRNRNKNSFLSDLFGNLTYTSLNLIDYMTIKDDDRFVKQSFNMPPVIYHYHSCYDPVYKIIQNFVTPKIKEMISAGNIIGAIKELGGEETEDITEIVRKKKQKEIEEMESIIKILEVRNIDKEYKETQIAILNKKINHLNIQLNDIDNRYKEILEGDCNICFEKLRDPLMEPNCHNIFCGKCLLRWLEEKNNCPLCKGIINKTKLIYIKNDNSISETKNNSEIKNLKKTKLETILNIIKEKQNGKFIIFSAWNQTFEPIRNMLKTNNILFNEVKGVISVRQKNINEFKFGNTNVVFLNSEYNGSGINMQEASDIIVYHEMDIDTMTQIIGRANRIGRTSSLYVHHLQLEQ